VGGCGGGLGVLDVFLGGGGRAEAARVPPYCPWGGGGQGFRNPSIEELGKGEGGKLMYSSIQQKKEVERKAGKTYCADCTPVMSREN